MKNFFSCVLCLAGMSFASMIGMDALGEEQISGGVASVAGRGFAGHAKTGDAEGVSVINPSRMAFDTKVVFNLNFLLDANSASHSDNSFSATNISLPSMNLSFPMGAYGTLGFSLWQRYVSNLREKIEDKEKVLFAEMEYNGSIYELVPSYSFRLPYLRSFALGASAHFVMGSLTRSLTLGADNSAIAKEDSWATNSAELSDHVEGDWEIKNHPAYYSLSAQYRGRQVSYFFSFTTSYTLSNELNYDFRFSELDTLEPTRYTREVKVPAMFATGINYRLFKRHNVMMDFQWRAWDDDIENVAGSFDLGKITKTQNDFVASVGYQRDGSAMFYDPYWDRMTYRAGAWYKNWYIENVKEIGGSIGVGFPLGRKGTTLDVAIQGGARLTDDDHNWNESFFAVRLGLVGIGNWGQTRSR